MQTAHILRKYEPLEWGGTETAVLRLVEGLKEWGVTSSIYCPRRAPNSTVSTRDPFHEAGFAVERFRSFLPVMGISPRQREQLVRLGGNLMSFQLYWQLCHQPVDLIHTHALNRLGGVGLLAARQRKIPLVVTIHGGALDLSKEVRAQLTAPLRGGVEWGKVLGLLIQSRRLLEKADAILACNPREVELLCERYPRQRVLLQQHSVPAAAYAVDHRETARRDFPAIAGRDVILCVARLHPVKNQVWLIRQFPKLLVSHPRALLVLAGSETAHGCRADLESEVEKLGLKSCVLFAGPVEPSSPTLIGLMQEARAMVLPSVAETFGLAILEAWAAGTPMISSRTSGACSLIENRKNGWLFQLDSPGEFHGAIGEALNRNESAHRVVAQAALEVRSQYDTVVAAGRVQRLYDELCIARRQGRRR